MYYPQLPILSTESSKLFQAEKLPANTNVILAIANFSGFNQEDAIVVNKSAVDRGLFRSVCFKTITGEEQTGGAFSKEEIELPPKNVEGKRGYELLEEDGIVGLGTEIKTDDIVIGKTCSSTSLKTLKSAIQIKKIAVLRLS